MHFKNPWAFYFLSLALPIALSHLVPALRRRVVKVPMLKLLLEVAEKNARPRRRRIGAILALIRRLSILVLIVFALAYPSIPAPSVPPIAIVIDGSASMRSLLPSGSTRFARAVAMVQDFILKLPVGTPVCIFIAGQTPMPQATWTTNHSDAANAIEKAKPDWTKSSIEQCLSIISKCAPSDTMTFIVTDINEVRKIQKTDSEAKWILVGSREGNAGITEFTTGWVGKRLVATCAVKNFSMEPCKLEIILQFNGREIGVIPVPLAPNEEAQKIIEPGYADERGGILSARIRYVLQKDEQNTIMMNNAAPILHDAFPFDDVAWAIVPPMQKVTVVLVTQSLPNKHLHLLLEVLRDRIDVENSMVLPPVGADQIVTQPGANVLFIYDDAAPLAKPQRGNFIFWGSSGKSVPVRLNGILKCPRVWEWNRNHPLNRNISHHLLQISKAHRISILPGQEALIHGEDYPLAVCGAEGELKYVYFSFNLQDSNFPMTVAFPMFFENALDWFFEDGTRYFKTRYFPGEALRPTRPLPDEVKYVRLSLCDGEKVLNQWDIAVEDMENESGPTFDEVGCWKIEFDLPKADWALDSDEPAPKHVEWFVTSLGETNESSVSVLYEGVLERFPDVSSGGEKPIPIAELFTLAALALVMVELISTVRRFRS